MEQEVHASVARKSREDWLRAGVKVLSRQGHEGLSVEGLAAQMTLTKGSFYHHFSSLKAFKTALVEHFDRVGFLDVVQRVDSNLPPEERLQHLTLILSQHDQAEVRAMRLWAERDEQARGLVQRLDERRLAYLAQLFSELTGDSQQGEFLARMAYAFYLGTSQLEPPIQGREYLRMVAALQAGMLATQAEGENHV